MNFYLYDKDLQYIKTYCPDHLRSEFANNPNFDFKILMDSKNQDVRNSPLSTESEKDEVQFQYNCKFIKIFIF